MKIPTAILLCLLLPAACGGDEGAASGPGSDAAQPGDHGDHTALGTVTVAGHRFAVALLGELKAGAEGAFEVELLEAPDGAPLADLDVYLWLEDAEGQQVSAPSRGSLEGDHLHVHATPRADARAPKSVVLRLRREGTDERGSLPLAAGR